MGVVSLSPEQLREQSQVYIRAKEGIDQQLQSVSRMNNQISEQWKGAAFQSYLQQYEQLSAQVKKFEELLVDINKQLNQYAQTIQERDTQDARGFGLN
jgi:WXG100 family type VII secretion target